MSTILVRRPPRRPGPEMPDGELQLQEPPVLPEEQSTLSAVFNYLPMAMTSMAMVLLFIRPGAQGSAINTYMPYVAGGMMLLGAVAMLVGQYWRARSERKQQLNGDRRDYLRYLAQSRARAREVVTAQRDAMLWRAPVPDALWSLVRTSRLWERRSTHDDFAEVRIAMGEQAMRMRIAPLSTKPVEDLEPLSAHALRRFIRAYATVEDQPVAVYLRGYARISLEGDADAARAMVRAMIGQLAVFHAHDELRIAVCAADDRRAGWDWVKWLPHAMHPTDRDGAGPVRLIADDAAELERVIGPELTDRSRFEPGVSPSREEPFTVIVVDGGQAQPSTRFGSGGYRNAVIVHIDDPLPWDGTPFTLALKVESDVLEVVGLDHSGRRTLTPLGRPDALSPARSRVLARMLAPYRMSMTTEVVEPLVTDFELTSLLGIANLHVHDTEGMWGDARPESRLAVPIGIAENGAPLELDLKESALGGMGPHGMLIGATGSGKSELLRTLVLSLALTHSPETLNFVLVDFKGGATFIGLDRLRHTSALITNLADEVTLVERMQDALHGELIRRQEQLRAAGNFSSIHEYEKARQANPSMEPMPTLFVVVDEFSELLAAHRDFMELFVMIGRLGRSLGVHLLLASQRLDEGRIHQLESHLSYRIALRTFSAIESRSVLGVPDAHRLPPAPGNGFLATGTDTLTRFKAAYVSGPYRVRRRDGPQAAAAAEIVPFLSNHVAGRAPSPEPEPVAEAEEDEDTESLLDVALECLHNVGPPARRVWLPPLGVPPTLDELLTMIGRPLPDSGPAWSSEPVLEVPLGVIDRPFEQLRLPLKAELLGAGGNIGIAGGPQSGKSTMLVTLVCALALTNTPDQVQFYGLDFGGGALQALTGLPHVGSVVGRTETDRINRTVSEMTEVLAHREQFFAEHGIDSMATYRRRRAAGEFADERYGDVFLVIDGWSTIRQDFMDLVTPLTQIAQRGLSYGVHLVVASPRWADIHSGTRDLLGTRFELRLGDAVDSTVNMRKAQTVPRIAGRGLTLDQYHFLTGLPRADGVGDPVSLSVGVTELIARVAGAWSGPGAPPVRTLPVRLTAAELPTAELTEFGGLRVPLGLEGRGMRPFWHDFSATPHLLVVGDTETGKTTLLRHITNAIREHYDVASARVVLVDLRRQLFDAVPKEQQLGYAVSSESMREMMGAAAHAMKARLPGPEITPDRLRRRDWWTGPELFIVIDDYDLVSGPSGGSLLAPIVEMLPQAADIGMHLIVARAAGGFGRATADPAIRSLIDSNTPSIMLSSPPSEGVLFGNVRARRMQPGRAVWISRRDPIPVQLAIAEVMEDEG
ncbi:type VII secretion protein EccCa [Nocardiopsis aegyptia]|uniref:S-DNA-T family DNA segregation ATPase FtsK/SpoIIIE n=1 Tax=Nocardiopsis aegyptia TaxID=220378 RepID=A0A7Z0ETD3_9ACTN|nr:type VII secretion protein EccCa [Nocardiopsis aegyptia]NYJ37897.1 S-DNA-T family DNA segregation ATPase FtsK/SpoIIIE [Nocardiopsis aegyptia]